MSFDISVVVCSYKCPPFINNTLKSLSEQEIANISFEILIVDYNESSEIPNLIKKWIDNHSLNIRYISESKKGLSNARNTGITESKSDIIAFIDDDATADPLWLDQISRSFATSEDVLVAGGKVVPLWSQTPPDWLDESLYRMLSVIDWGDVPRCLKWPERLIGTNIAFRKEVFDRFGTFDERLGRFGNNLIGSEEIELQKKVMDYGYQVYYCPNAVVRHLVPPDRMEKEYFYRRAYGSGKSDAILAKKNYSGFRLYERKLSAITKLGINHIARKCVRNDGKRHFTVSKNICYYRGFLERLKIPEQRHE